MNTKLKVEYVFDVGHKENITESQCCAALNRQAFLFMINCSWILKLRLLVFVCTSFHMDTLMPLYEKRTIHYRSGKYTVKDNDDSGSCRLVYVWMSHGFFVCLCVVWRGTHPFLFVILHHQINVRTVRKKNTPSFSIGDKEYILVNDCLCWLFHL